MLDEAKRITAADRQDDYGPPSEDFARTAMLWTAILAGRLRDGQLAWRAMVRHSREWVASFSGRVRQSKAIGSTPKSRQASR